MTPKFLEIKLVPNFGISSVSKNEKEEGKMNITSLAILGRLNKSQSSDAYAIYEIQGLYVFLNRINENMKILFGKDSGISSSEEFEKIIMQLALDKLININDGKISISEKGNSVVQKHIDLLLELLSIPNIK